MKKKQEMFIPTTLFFFLSGKTFLLLFLVTGNQKWLHFVCRGEAYQYRGLWTDNVF